MSTIKPPLGATPRHVLEWRRILELCRAVADYGEYLRVLTPHLEHERSREIATDQCQAWLAELEEILTRKQP